ncbi:EAL domain-containing protein [Komagataeibacter saccharivorans]|uniref:EAL domain-containing protein n=1 Tax=Komagataeibacter saccharivorans TaxID=265959 RepID=UPI000C82592C|nr:EAL domain-containing protein [Komagataeibacter saccharivorans]
MPKPKLSAEVLILALEQAADATIIIDDAGRVILFNRAAEKLWGLDRQDVLGQSMDTLLPQPHRSRYEAFINRSSDSTVAEGDATHEVAFTRSDGMNICGELSLSRVNADTGRCFYTGVMKNVTSACQQHKILILQNDVLRALASNTLMQDVADLMCRRVESFVPDAVAAFLLIEPDGSLLVLASPTLPNRYRSALESLPVSGPEMEKLRADARHATHMVWDSYRSLGISLGLQQCFSMPVHCGEGQVKGIFALYTRVEQGANTWAQRVVDACVPFCALAFEKNAAQEHISHLANFDPLTGLLNRTAVHREIEKLIARQEGNRQLAVFMLDIDRFRDINDALGHIYADQFLVEIAQRLRSIVKDGDIISRSNGNEFVVIAPDCTNEDATDFARLLLDTIARPMRVGQNTLTISCSIGISIFPTNGPDSESLLSTANAAMRRARTDRRGAFRFASPAKSQLAQDRLVLGSALRDSLAEGMLKLHYQPQVRIHTLELTGVEALARWHHPRLGNIFPSRFIAVAEETGQIEAIGQWALLEACRQIVKWDRDGIHVPTVAVNLSAVHFRNQTLPAYIDALLKDHGLSPARLTVEITESVTMDSSHETESVLDAVRALGCGLSMDDFGTGYSSLSRLTRLPLTEIKMDRSFIHNFEHDTNVQAVTMAVIGIGRRLGMTVVGEGVETAEQRALLEELDCDVMQGYLFARPQAPGELAQWVRQHRTVGDAVTTLQTARDVPPSRKPS